MSKIEIDEIEAKRIVLKGVTVDITIDADFGGIWINKKGEQSPSVCLYIQGDIPVVGVYGKDKSSVGCAAALSADANSNGILQILKDGKLAE